MRTIRSKPAGNSICSVSGSGRIVCEESGVIKAAGVWTERLLFYWPPLLVHTHSGTILCLDCEGIIV